MKKEEILELVKDFEKMPIGSLVWQKRKTTISKEQRVVSIIHNTSKYSLDSLYKPISKIIDFNEK